MASSRTLISILLVLGLLGSAAAQDKKPTGAKPANMLEVGAHGGYLFVAGDVKQKPGFGGGIHIRKAIDYMFSIRADVMMGKAKGDVGYRDFNMNWLSGSVFGVLSLNNFRFDSGVRKSNIYFMLGGGFNQFETDFNREEPPRKGTIEKDWASHAAGGAGIAFRLSPRVNIGIEHQALVAFGRRADQIDGSEKEEGIRTPFRDIVNYTSIRLNFNLGSASKLAEPLYWVNPMETVYNELDNMKNRQDEMLGDSDGDGVIDGIDQEPNTPANASVDTKGRTLDSDKDGVPDYRDKEPFYPPRAGEKVNPDGVVMNPLPPAGAAGGVTEQRVQEMIDEALSKYQLTESGTAVAEWFLPMIHFATESATIKYSDYGTLASIGRMMKSNPNLRLVVLGHTDQTGNEAFNDFLSYQRAKGVIDHLVTNYGIGRGRLLLQWKGKNDALVPSSSSYMNRRVEFRVAQPGDTEMDPPKGTDTKKSGY